MNVWVEQYNTINERGSLKNFKKWVKIILDGGLGKNLYFGFLKENNVYF